MVLPLLAMGARAAGMGRAATAAESAGSRMSKGGSASWELQQGMSGKDKEIQQGLLETFKNVKGMYRRMEQSSPMLKQQMVIMQKSLDLFFRPFGDALSSLFRPFVLAFYKLAMGFYKFFSIFGGQGEEDFNSQEEIDKLKAEIVADKAAGLNTKDKEASLKEMEAAQAKITAEKKTTDQMGLLSAAIGGPLGVIANFTGLTGSIGSFISWLNDKMKTPKTTTPGTTPGTTATPNNGKGNVSSLDGSSDVIGTNVYGPLEKDQVRGAVLNDPNLAEKQAYMDANSNQMKAPVSLNMVFNTHSGQPEINPAWINQVVYGITQEKKQSDSLGIIPITG